MPEVRTRPSDSGAEPLVYIPLSLKTPDGEIQIELSVLVDGQPTPEVLTQLIQRAVTEASEPRSGFRQRVKKPREDTRSRRSGIQDKKKKKLKLKLKKLKLKLKLKKVKVNLIPKYPTRRC